MTNNHVQVFNSALPLAPWPLSQPCEQTRRSCAGSVSFRPDIFERNTASLSGVYPKTVSSGDGKLAGEPPLNVHKLLLQSHEFSGMGLFMAEHSG